jgi:predicted alpha/beta-fold hydrolase
MPLIEHSGYKAPWLFRNPHFQTIYASKVRVVWRLPFARERIETPDADFFDVDWVRRGNKRLVIILHGLGGSTRSRDVPAFGRQALAHGWDIACVNYRGCSGEPNRLFRSYHSGATEDPLQLLELAHTRDGYERVGFAGFSLGGNITLKLLGELGSTAPRWLCGAVALAAPTHLASCADVLARVEMRAYMRRFIVVLSQHLDVKNTRFPGVLKATPARIRRMRRFHEFDEAVTAPANGFASAQDYWARASSKPLLPRIAVPTLLISALDDPFLSPECHPFDEARASAHLTFEPTIRGGHVGWVTPWSARGNGAWWHETRAMDFLEAFGTGT